MGNEIYGSTNRECTQKTGYTLPRTMMNNSDLTRIINSDEVQSKVRDPIKTKSGSRLKKNPLKNLGVKVRLNPYALSLRRSELLAQQRREANKVSRIQAARATRKSHPAATKKANYSRMADDGLPEVEEVEAVAEEEA